MNLISFLVTWFLPGIGWFFKHRVELKSREHFEAHGYKHINPIHWLRLRQASIAGAMAYVVTMFFLQSVGTFVMHGFEASLPANVFFLFIAVAVYYRTWKIFRVFQETYAAALVIGGGPVTGQSELTKFNQEYVKPPAPITAQGEYGDSVIDTAEGLGLTGDRDMEPKEKVGG